MDRLLERLNWIIKSRGGAICFVEEPAVATEEETGGVVTTVKEEVTKDLDVQAALEEAEGEEKPPVVTPKPKPIVKDDDDDDGEVDFKSLTPEQQKAVGRLYKDRRATKRQIRDLQRTVDELKVTRREEPVAVKTDTVPGLKRPDKPNPEDFDSPKAYKEAEMKYEDELFDYREAVKDAKSAEASAKNAQAKAIVDHNDRQAKFAETHDDYEDVVDNDLSMSDIMFGAVMTEEVGPALAYYLGSNPDENNKIYAMAPQAQIKALMRIIVKLEDEGDGKKKEEVVVKPKARQPEPPAPVRGQQALPKDTSKMSFKEREKQFAKEHPELMSYTP